ncbi:MAG: TonB-dependent receptor [Candidatus Eremiobacteraeota bacterium]|nr:TonB-dependent receptor [Candidatus Eremiobacteraeota bacterium]MBC5820383.1 TonB-dependent receptor [Candidatus Eremiobacteraeota bacterium]
MAPYSPPKGTRLIAGVLLAVALFFNTVGTLFAAGTTGTINGHVTDSRTGAGIAGVVVNAVAPTGSYRATTDNSGFFVLTGVQPDTYTISFQKQGFQPASTQGVTVSADQTADATTRLMSVNLRTIARVTTRSVGNAYQPKQTQDTYTVTSVQIQSVLGKSNALSETQLLTRLPGATLDRYGYPVLRGGRETDEGFEYDGIPYVDALSSQFTNSLTLNASVNQLQLTPGAGDASTGNAGTGTINLVAKRGTNPPFGTLDAEALTRPYTHQLSFEYGMATPNGAISNYFQFTGTNGAYGQFGNFGTPAATLSNGIFENPAYENSRSITDNLVFKFGHGYNQSFQILYDAQQTDFLGTYGTNTLTYAPGDPYFLTEFSGISGLTTTQVQSRSLYGLLPNQPTLSGPLGSRGASNSYQPNNVLKFQYSNNLSPSSFVTAKYYALDSVVTFDDPNNGTGIYFQDAVSLQGGHRSGGTIDYNNQLSSKHQFSAGAEYDFLHPVFNQLSPGEGILDAGSAFTGASGIPAYAIADFINPNAPGDLGACPLGADPNGKSYCGYLYNFSKSPGAIPGYLETTQTNQQDYAVYLRDKYTPNDKLTIDFGLRVDGDNEQLPGLQSCNPATFAAFLNNDSCQYQPTGSRTDAAGNQIPSVTLPSNEKNPFEFEPRLAISYQIGRNDAVRASFARSTELAPLAFTDLTVPAGYYSNAVGNNVPSYDVFANVVAGTPVNYAAYPAMTCGVNANQRCHNYADQLHWYNQAFAGVPIQPVRPETFTNLEFSYSHQFPAGIGLKVTPFYRRGYDQLALVAQALTGANGQPLVNAATGSVILGPNLATNLGINRTTGIEFYLTRDVPYGLSTTLSASYINEFSNVVPSPLIQEDFFPSIVPQSLLLGNQYRVGFVAPFSGALTLNYKMHNGVRINPIFTFNGGYPAGVGNVTAAFVNGKAYNVPQTNGSSSSAPYGQNYAPNFVDPQNPGSIFNPNIAASRGTRETSSAGGFLTNPRLATNISVEYSPPGSRSTFGVLITNLFDQIYSGVPTYNSRYQAVATGVAGPKTGTTPISTLFPEIGVGNYGPTQFGNQPYRITNSLGPTEARLYYQLAL